jgi:hypothetical protein
VTTPLLEALEPAPPVLEPAPLLELELVLEPCEPLDPELDPLAPLVDELNPLEPPLDVELDPGSEHAASTTDVVPLPLLALLPPMMVQTPPASQGFPLSSGGHAAPNPPELLAAASLGSVHVCSS